MFDYLGDFTGIVRLFIDVRGLTLEQVLFIISLDGAGAINSLKTSWHLQHWIRHTQRHFWNLFTFPANMEAEGLHGSAIRDFPH